MAFCGSKHNHRETTENVEETYETMFVTLFGCNAMLHWETVRVHVTDVPMFGTIGIIQ